MSTRRKRLAITGTREPNPAQAERVRQAVHAALGEGWRIVAGGASGIDRLAVLAAQEAGHARDVTLVLPWEKFEQWHLGDERILRAVFDPEERVDHQEWLAELLRLLPNARTKNQGAVKCLARDIGIIRMADAVFAFPRPDAPAAGEQQSNLPEYARQMGVFRQSAGHRQPEFGGGTGFTIRVARELEKPLWIDGGSAKPGTPFRSALVRDRAVADRAVAGACVSG